MSMDTLEAIFTRRSIRAYTGEAITDEQLHTILRAGFSAPTAMNKRPWHFIVMRDADTLQKITTFHPYSKMLPKAGCGILVCGDLNLSSSEYFLAEDCSAAMENMLLAAHALDLGAVWMGVFPRDERMQPLRELLALPEHVLPIGLMAVGVPAESRDAPDRFEAEKVHLEKW
jgi:nitroreductase